jgi:hypothetical protein
VVEDTVDRKRYPSGMVGGYARIIVMTKLPGENLQSLFWTLPLSKRDII